VAGRPASLGLATLYNFLSAPTSGRRPTHRMDTRSRRAGAGRPIQFGSRDEKRIEQENVKSHFAALAARQSEPQIGHQFLASS
jgi:hypothetical protein